MWKKYFHDTIEESSQPLRSDDGDLVLVANGEVDNHRELAKGLGVELRTGSDCEVLLHLYRAEGMGFLDRVRGMLGLVLWDGARGRLIASRSPERSTCVRRPSSPEGSSPGRPLPPSHPDTTGGT